VILLLAKVGAMSFSIFAGYFYFEGLYLSLLNSGTLSKVFTIPTLALIELSTAIAITKFFKFALRSKWSYTAVNLFIAATLFSISFVSSTNGLALRQSSRVDKTEEIKKDYKTERQALKDAYKIDRKELQSFINLELNNPQGWKGSKREILLKDQLKRISNYQIELKGLSDTYQGQLKGLKDLESSQIKDNEALTNAEANRYYNIVAFVMALIFLLNCALVYFYSRIVKETNKDFSKNELKRQIEEEADKFIQNTFNARLSTYAPGKVKQTLRIEEAKVIEQRTCKHCGKAFDIKHWNQLYCNEICKMEFKNDNK